MPFVELPFVLVQSAPDATVDVEISKDNQLVHFDFNGTPFQIHDSNDVLCMLGLGEAHAQQQAAVPPPPP